MVKCNAVQIEILHGELDASTREHIAQCESCQAFHESRQLLGDVSHGVVPCPDYLDFKTLNARSHSQENRTRVAKWAAPLVAALFLFVLNFHMPGSQRLPTSAGLNYPSVEVIEMEFASLDTVLTDLEEGVLSSDELVDEELADLSTAFDAFSESWG